VIHDYEKLFGNRDNSLKLGTQDSVIPTVREQIALMHYVVPFLSDQVQPSKKRVFYQISHESQLEGGVKVLLIAKTCKPLFFTVR